ncbi:Protein FAR1-RELATED SEQUENCE 5 [Frankliniella fusca]|uniref:Protein FAR1-RELATED SEQUENCE 5 n=1 Tax=Frankliniella fusca TaxID=407009 RepID=A0AAE1LB35_9NEOP|nr:Protein FAR1-RELATED SEQUENCE 5 [Frankliniella fusca]
MLGPRPGPAATIPTEGAVLAPEPTWRAGGEERALFVQTGASTGGVKPAVVRSVLRGLTGNVTARDLANYRAKWKNQENKERLVDTLANLLDNDPDASVYVERDESDDLKFLFLQTSAMRRNVQMYGMVLLMDHSNKVNRNRMPVCVLMVMDGDGNGRSAGYAFVADEQQFTVSEVLTAFRESITEEVASKLTTIIMDKDPSEIAAIENVFPEVHIQLCSFHVSKTLKEKSVKESDRVKETLDNLKDKKHGLNFGNTTTNRVENHNSKIKMIVNSNSTLADAVEGLLNVFLNKEEDVLHREIVSAMKRSYVTTALDDPIINQILTDLKQYPANLLIWEFKQIPEEKEINDYEGSADVCYCPHMWMFKLPCRHMFQCRRVKGEQLYRPDEIASMWKKKKSAEIEPVPGASGLVKKKVLLNGVPAKPKDKYTASLETGKLISSLLSENGDRQYAERHSLLKSLLKMWSAGKEVVLLEKPEGADNNAYRVQPCVAVIVDTAVETFTAGENPEPKQKDTEDTSISEIPGPERMELHNTLNSKSIGYFGAPFSHGGQDLGGAGVGATDGGQPGGVDLL